MFALNYLLKTQEEEEVRENIRECRVTLCFVCLRQALSWKKNKEEKGKAGEKMTQEERKIEK